MKKYDNLAEVQKDRIELENKFEEGLPTYLVDFFDEKEKQFGITEHVKNMEDSGADPYDIAKYKWSLRSVPEKDDGEIPNKPIKNIEENEVGLSYDEIAIFKEVCKYDIYAFAVRYFKHYLKRRSSKLHRYLYKLINRKILDRKGKKSFKIAIAAPRGNAKSSLIDLIFPLWCICYSRKKFIVIISDTGRKAEGFLKDIKRELIYNEKLVRDFPEVVGKGPIWRVDEIETKNGITLMSTGTGSNIRGEKEGEQRPDLVLMDDLENMEMVRSKTMRENIRNDWFNKDVLYVGGEKGSEVDFFVIGTILGKDSLLNALLDSNQYPDWESRKFSAVLKYSDSDLWKEWEEIYKNNLEKDRIIKAEKFFEDHKDEMLAGTEVLWPEGDPYYELMVEKISDPSGFESEKMNNPIDPSKIIVSKEELNMLDFRVPNIQSILNDPRNSYFAALDPSLGKNQTADDSCIVTILRDRKTGLLYLVDIDLRRRTVDQQVSDLLRKYIRFGHKNIGIETNAFQIVLADNIRKASRKAGAYMPITDIQNYSDKHMRILSIVPLLKDGTIIFDRELIRNSQQYSLGLDHLTTYYEGCSNDDFPDALEQCVRICRSRRFKLTTKENK